MRKIKAIVLAAGKSTRLRSRLPKVLHNVRGRPLVTYPVSALLSAGVKDIVIIINAEFEDRFAELFKVNKNISFAIQKEQLGTASAVDCARKNAENADYVLIVPGDVPLIKPDTLANLIKTTVADDAACGLISMMMENPGSYGRIIRDKNNDISAIVEKKDATQAELTVKEVNSSVYCAKGGWLFKTISSIRPNNAQKEFYLTDIVKIAVADGLRAKAVVTDDSSEVLGVNTRNELAEADKIMRKRILDKLMADGVSVVDPSNTYIDIDVSIGQETIIHPNCHIYGNTSVGRDCVIETGCVITNSHLEDNVRIKPYSVIDESKIQAGAVIGPFARIRPNSLIGENVKIGNFVEVKKATFGPGSKASHLSYIGDSVIGKRTNIGCGTITCNYDGKAKHQTTIGDDVFVGSDVQFVAPVKIGNNATIGAGSTITEDVPDNSLAIARSGQVVKKSWTKK